MLSFCPRRLYRLPFNNEPPQIVGVTYLIINNPTKQGSSLPFIIRALVKDKVLVCILMLKGIKKNVG